MRGLVGVFWAFLLASETSWRRLPPVETSDSSAVFISYAREDTDAARRIAEALRKVQIKVWFAYDGLGAGDRPDLKIPIQIDECSLFVPVISRNAVRCKESNFRGEWNRAIGRTPQIADDTPFLVPVVVDDTQDSDSSVPEAFRKVQWTRLPPGRPTVDFVKQVQALIARRRTPVRPTAPDVRAQGTSAPRKANSGVWLGATVGVLALAALGYLFLRTKPSEVPAAVAPAPVAAAPAVVVTDKSIAVLPLANLSGEKDSGFFVDGMHDELITDLAAIADLKVISRTSVLQYRDTRLNLKAIGKELGVAYIVEGSVRHAGNHVVVTAQLIDSRSDTHVWAGTFEKDIPDVFALQAALAHDIAGALQAKLTPAETKRIERARGAPLEVYQLAQQARAIIFAVSSNTADYHAALRLAQKAVELEPGFAFGWATVGHVRTAFVYRGFDLSEAMAREASDAIDRSLALDPDLPEGHWALGRFYQNLRIGEDIKAAMANSLVELERARSGMPNEPRILADIASTLFYGTGNFEGAIALERRAVELNPNDPLSHYNLARMYENSGTHLRENFEETQRAIKLDGNFVAGLSKLAGDYLWMGNLEEAQHTIDRISPSLDESRAVFMRFWVLYLRRRPEEALKVLRDTKLTFFRDTGYYGPKEYLEAKALRMAGDRAGSDAKFRVALNKLDTDTSHVLFRAEVAAYLGDRRAAVEELEKYSNRLSIDNSTFGSQDVAEARATIYALIGEKAKAVDALEYLVHVAHWETPQSVALYPQWTDNLKGFPRFDALIAEPGPKL